jgi:hypothetical protein
MKMLFLLALLPSAQWRDGSSPVPGTFGTYTPEAAQKRFADTTVHTDTHGGTVQELQALSGAAGGYSVLWRDHRDGLAGLYLARLGPRAERRGPEEVVHRPYAGRRLQPDLVVAPSGAGAVVWIHEVMNVPVVFGHAYNSEGHWEGPDRTLTPMPQSLQPRGGRDQGARQPRLALRPEGGYYAAWLNRGGLHWVECDHELAPLGETRLFGGREVAVAGPFAWIGTAQAPLAIWSADNQVLAARVDLDQRPRVIAEGKHLDVQPTKEGALLLAEQGGRASVRVLDPRGELVGQPIAVGLEGEQALGIAALPGHAAVLVESPTSPRWRVDLLDLRKSALLRSLPLEIADLKRGSVPRIAASGRELLVAWTANGGGDGDPSMLRVEPFAEGGAAHGPERVATDAASSDQINPRIAAAGERGALVWVDRRSGEAQPWARRFDGSGLVGVDWALPARGASSVSAIAMQDDGRFAIAWAEASGLALQAYSADGTAQGDCVRMARATPRELVLLPVRGARDWRLFWVEGEQQVQTISLAADLQASGPALVLGIGQRVSATQLLGGAWVCVFDRRGERSELFGRSLSAGGQPGEPFGFEATPSGHDWDAALAPARDGGFLMSWTSGDIDTPLRDIVARRFDARARPSGPLLWIGCTGNEQDTSDAITLADGSFLVAYEDDLSGYDHTLAQRIDPAGRRVGALVRLNQLEATHLEDRVAPRVAPFGAGFTAAFGDRRRSQGWDVSWTIYGPGFDELPPK